MVRSSDLPTPPLFVLVQGSLNPHSYTAALIDEVAQRLAKRSATYEIVDLRRVDMDFCDGRAIEHYNQDTQRVYSSIERADAYIFGMPVYSYSISGALKNVIDITASAMRKKVAGILCNTAGTKSYMAAVDLMKVLSYEADVVTIQPIVHTDRTSFKDGKLFDDTISDVLDEMVEGVCRYVGLPRPTAA